mmetsp:Transcript_10500/g.25654  ORF Transcript_10500/g.25654 Transcript_10500/m.25654 type:complete len:167 (-) Transcript_10500:139-639(-)|eukprot:CAMPEP_0178993856 /NCGR_PEP_ID=MMETSP0795-20121207/6946_1 /TAXON_ID=88552 /ORGANISM="Amoebophrya sp., Strain Ameob2" /LENGTH=166 /DNA_ID=CAMNT_0020685983 /DNA_START=139 /DNA_END=639 /DNA_ORIENTATION=+
MPADGLDENSELESLFAELQNARAELGDLVDEYDNLRKMKEGNTKKTAAADEEMSADAVEDVEMSPDRLLLRRLIDEVAAMASASLVSAAASRPASSTRSSERSFRVRFRDGASVVGGKERSLRSELEELVARRNKFAGATATSAGPHLEKALRLATIGVGLSREN